MEYKRIDSPHAKPINGEDPPTGAKGPTVRIQWISDTILTQLALLAIAFLLSAIIGLERQHRLKAAGVKTHSLVGLGSALFTLVSAYGFSDISTAASVDPTRVAAQIVSGIGFLGAGVIFVRHDTVSGLTTAASIWVTAAVGMACGAGTPTLACATAALYLVSVFVLGRMTHLFVSSPDCLVLVRYREGIGALRNTLVTAADQGYEALLTDTRNISRPGRERRFQATIRLRNTTEQSAEPFLTAVPEIPGVLSAKLMKGELD